MKDLFLETPLGRLPLTQDEIKKYSLSEGSKSPFTGYRIVDKNGNCDISTPQKVTIESSDEESQPLTTSEVLDFMQGSDSSDA